MMLLPFTLITVLIFMVTQVESDCFSMHSDDTLYCKGLDLKPDEAISVNTSDPKLLLEYVTGSIGVKTFSLLSHIVELKIQYSAIDSIEDGALCAPPKLETINLYYTQKFPNLTQSLLSNCDKIKSFKLINIKISPDAFTNMVNLEDLQLRNMDFPQLTREYLEPLKNLKVLEFRKCRFDKIDAGSVCLSPRLEWLMFLGSLVRPPLSKSMFESCKMVSKFDFHYNHNALVEEEAFSGFTSVKESSLYNLDIKHLKKGHLAGFSNLEELKLGHSNITKIDIDTFQGFDNLKKLNLGYNDLTELDSGVFASIPNLIHLDVIQNKIRSINQFKHPKIEELYVGLNMIAEIDTKAVRLNLPNLKELLIFGNEMSAEYEDRVRWDLEGVLVPKSGTPKMELIRDFYV